MANIGKAYGFLYYGGKTEDIVRELSNVRDFARTPRELTQKVSDIDGFNTEDSALEDIVKSAKINQMSHVIEAEMPQASNRTVANELFSVFSYVYLSGLYQKNEPFNDGIVYKRGNSYIFNRPVRAEQS